MKAPWRRAASDRCLVLALAGLLASEPAPAQVTAEQALANARRLTAPIPCAASGTEEEIVVCARRRSADAYRLPPTDARGLPGDVRGRAGEVPSASPERLSGAPCGIFAGERRCGKAEAKLYGYGGGKNPVAVLLKLGAALADPDR